ncbi:MAG: glycosyltransferase family 4 protein [Acidimicrobiia bacterium]|nr:glycosyltransferase family 4 protein [Acidimicrobiia bacterium]
MIRHVLVTNDFPPKVGGIQNYLWELWRRLPPDSFAVYTTPYAGAVTFDAQQRYRIERSPEPFVGPYPWLVERLNRFVDEVNAELVVLDPAVPLGALGRRLDRPYAVVLHGAEVTVPARLPLARRVLASTLRSATLVIAAGQYALDEAERCAGRPLPSVVIPPGVDSERFRPFPDDRSRAVARARFGVGDDDFLIAAVSRLVPRKGLDVLVRASAELSARLAARPAPGAAAVQVLIGGDGRHRRRLERLITATGAPVRLLGRLADDDVAELYAAADAMAMLCHDRWFGLEQEGFGIVFLEAAAAGVPQIAGRSGGAHEAVANGVTGLVLDDPHDERAVAAAAESLARDPVTRSRLGSAARARAIAEFSYDQLAERLAGSIDEAVRSLGAYPE